MPTSANRTWPPVRLPSVPVATAPRPPGLPFPKSAPPWPPTTVAVTDVTQPGTTNWLSPADVYLHVTVVPDWEQPLGRAAAVAGANNTADKASAEQPSAVTGVFPIF